MKFRHVTAIPRYLIAGVCGAFGVSWILSAALPLTGPPDATRSTIVSVRTDIAAPLLVQVWERSGSFRADATYTTTKGLWIVDEVNQSDPVELVPAWARPQLLPWLEPGSPLARTYYEYRSIETRGWPFPCLVVQVFERRRHGEVLTIEGGFTNGWFTDDEGLPLPFPYRPLWTGLAINSLFYAVAVAAAHASAAYIMCRIRIRNGKCPECGYSQQQRRDSGCPECGWNRSCD